MLKERDSTNVSVPSNAYNDYIETLYESIVSVLHNSAIMFIPRLRQTTLKPWWSDILNKLKAKALDSHALWEACGRLKSGLIFDVRNRDKLNYKAEIRRALMGGGGGRGANTLAQQPKLIKPRIGGYQIALQEIYHAVCSSVCLFVCLTPIGSW